MGGTETINKQQKLLELRTQKEMVLYVQEAGERRIQIKIRDKEYILSDHDTREDEIIKELKTAECNDLEDMVFKME